MEDALWLWRDFRSLCKLCSPEGGLQLGSFCHLASSVQSTVCRSKPRQPCTAMFLVVFEANIEVSVGFGLTKLPTV